MATIRHVNRIVKIDAGNPYHAYVFEWDDGSLVHVARTAHRVFVDPFNMPVDEFQRRTLYGNGVDNETVALGDVPYHVLLGASGANASLMLFDSVAHSILSSETDECDPETGGSPLDENYGFDDLTAHAKAKIALDCSEFWHMAQPLVHRASHKQSGRAPIGLVGHDFVMSRNGHGCGFWDGDWSPEDVAESLHDISRSLGEISLHVTDDDTLECE